VKLEKVWAVFLIRGEDPTAQVKKCASDFVKLEHHDIPLFTYPKGCLARNMRAMFGCK
jgi:hypothetical protein